MNSGLKTEQMLTETSAIRLFQQAKTLFSTLPER